MKNNVKFGLVLAVALALCAMCVPTGGVADADSDPYSITIGDDVREVSAAYMASEACSLVISWGDEKTSSYPSVAANATVNATHTYDSYGVYTVTFTVTPDEGDSGAVYTATVDASVQAQINAGGTITLDADVGQLIVPAGKTVVLNLNGKSVTSDVNSRDVTYTFDGETTVRTYYQGTIINYGTLTISGSGTVANTASYGSALLNFGTAILNSGDYQRAGNNNSNYVIANEGTMTINGGTYISTQDNGTIICNGYWHAATLTINGGTVSQPGSGRALDLKNDEFGTMTINGGTFNGGASNNNWHDMTINGGTFTSSLLCCCYDETSSITTINGGTFKGDFIGYVNDASTTGTAAVVFHGGILDGSDFILRIGNTIVDSVSNVTFSFDITKTFVIKNMELTIGGLTFVAGTSVTSSDGKVFEMNASKVSGTAAANQVLNVKGISQIDSLVLTKGAKLNVDRDATLTVNTALTSDKTQSDIALNGKIVVKGSATVTGMAAFGHDSAVLDAVKGYGSGFTLSKGSVVLAGDVTEGTITVNGIMKVNQDVALTSTQIVISAGSMLEVVADKTLTGGTIVNKGTVNVYGTVTSGIDNTSGKVLTYNGGTVTGTVTGNTVKTVAIKIVEFTVPEIKVGQTLLIPIDTIPDSATLYLQGNSWFKVSGHQLVGVPEKAGTYNYTLSASVIEDGTTYTDSYEFSVKVTADPDAQEDSGFTFDVKTIIIIILVVVFILALIVPRFL